MTPVTAGRDVYDVVLREEPGGWTVEIVEHGGTVVSSRACRDAGEARVYASTVRQHLYWLSPEKFREFYRIEEPTPEAG